MKKREYGDYIQDILDATTAVEEFVSGRTISFNELVLNMQISELYSQGVHGVAFYSSDEGINYPELRPLYLRLKKPTLFLWK